MDSDVDLKANNVQSQVFLEALISHKNGVQMP